MQLGSVFIWKKFPFREEGKEKDRYFVYFGESHYQIIQLRYFLLQQHQEFIIMKKREPEKTIIIIGLKLALLVSLKTVSLTSILTII